MALLVYYLRQAHRLFAALIQTRSKRHTARQPCAEPPSCHAVCFLPPRLKSLRSGGVWSGRAAASARRIARGTRRGSTPPSRPSRRALRSRRLRSLRPGPQGPALAGTARLGFVYSAARSPTHFVPLPARTLPASLRLEGCAPAVTDRCGGAALRCPRRHEPLRLAPCVPRLRRCTPAASRRSLGLAVAPGLAPGANPAKPRAAMKRRNARRRSMKG